MAPAPKSLLQIAGAPLHPSALDKSALVIIDAQVEYTKGSLPLDGVDAAIVEAAKLLKLARVQGVPVFHIVQHAPSGRPLFAEDGPTAPIVQLLTPAAGEVVVRKTLPNSFAGTDLDALVKSTGRSELILAGFMTHMCVSATARAATDLKYRTTIVANATATRDLPDPLGGTIPASVVHRVALSELADRFAIVVKDTAALTASAQAVA
ncbi:nicotinamidase-related amidase [Afipia massiliensis]|uniref:Nicotinamidase-related amidase n=1 Tax=Afipia massiliensis TaxID=211460 RepID=A0A840N9M7_9BRAD|nr:cysteine hydrolase family protein [Afipia massiliensis]MBB5054401.1 nicotinamidase-related amidase [Afipia massiliensis]